ncbi:unannotated protein [freshwater metagenome]|uniref:Unannotated protein n=1 Tax=freshwater metagenome TaxID=449393 RepID=A0A6J6HF18_9ZZZZ|nr:uridine diphosphate-N-acetylglucosamine-binding protein YvcK [Actinomycetota bacterium]
MSSARVVALGGGHGLAATLSSLRAITDQITAIVTVADNGGSSGRLRQEFPIFPPGDLRMALAALCADDDWGRSWADIMQYRFTSEGPLDGHAVGNLLLAALWDRDEDPVAGLDRVGALLKVVGRVLPMAAVPLEIEATFTSSIGRINVRGQVEVATAKGKLESLRIIPENPAARSEALAAISTAEVITIGPGSWISSVLPHLLVPAQRDAIINSKAKKVVLLNLDASVYTTGDEYAGYSAEEHLQLLNKYAPELKVDYVVADSDVVSDHFGLEKLVKSMGGELISAELSMGPGSSAHDVRKLTPVLAHIIEQRLVG